MNSQDLTPYPDTSRAKNVKAKNLSKRILAWSTRRFPANSFGRALGTLLGGSLIGQTLLLLAAPFITRIYSPGDFGALGVYLSIVGVLTVGAMLRYEVAIPGAEESEVLLLLALSIGIALSISILVTLTLLAVHRYLSFVHSLQLLWPDRYFIAPGVFTACSYIALSYWSIRKRDFSLLSQTKITQNATLVTTQIGMGVAHFGAPGLLCGQITGQIAGSVSILRKMRRVLTVADHGVSLRMLWKTAVRYQRFPRLSLPASFMEACASAIPLLLMAAEFGNIVAGWMTFVQRIVFIPLALLTANMTQIFFGELAAMKRESPSSMRSAYIARLRKLSKLSLALCIPVACLAPIVIPPLFGARWKGSIVCLEILMPLMLASFIATPFGCVLDVLERQDLHLLRDIIRLALVSAAAGLAVYLKLSWRPSLMLISAAACIGYAIYLWLSWIGVRDHHIIASQVDAALLQVHIREGL